MKIITKAIGVALAATALCGLGVATASAAVPNTARHTPNQLGDPSSFRVDLLNNSTSPLQITSYSGSDWDTADRTPAVGTTVGEGQEIGVFLYSEGGANDAVYLKSTDSTGTIGLNIAQDHIGGESDTVLPGSTLTMNVRSSGDGYNILNITTPTAYSEKMVEAFNTSLDGLHSTGIPAFTCPADHPWLVNQNLSPGRIVPNGVQVDEPGSIGVTIPNDTDDSGDVANGWQSGGASATNWDVSTHSMIIYAHCTNDPAQTYQG